jgi:hypothetical protein
VADLAKLAKLQTQKQWSWRIWESLVCYANAQDDRGKAALQKVGDFKTMLSECMNWIGGGNEDVEACLDMKEGASLNDLETRYRADIRRVLTWLSDPDQHSELAARTARFLGVYGASVKMAISANPTFDSEDADEPLLMEWPEPCESVVAPVCKFILDQIESHDIEGEVLRDVIPIGLCGRSGCDRFFVIERTGRRFCSSKCRAGAYQGKLTKEQRAARMRKYRATLKEQERVWIQKRKNRK